MRATTMPSFAVLLAVSLLALAPAAPREAPPDPAELAGQPFARALEMLGPPDGGAGVSGCIGWSWRYGDAGMLRLITHQELVVYVDTARLLGDVVVRPIPAKGHYPGQLVAELLQRLGPASRATAGIRPGLSPRPAGPGEPLPPPIADLGLHFVDGLRLMVSDGRVLGPEPAPMPVHGPR